jgi:hypothetical protein
MSGLDDPDAVFAALIAAHAGLDEDAARRLDAMLVLLLAEAVGDTARVMAAIAEARRLI